MKEYHITLSLAVDAHDDEEAAKIASELCEMVTANPTWKVRDVEANDIEEMG